jgi:hypothetical protein
MIYWFLLLLAVFALIIIAGIVRSRVLKRKKLAEIRAQWGMPKYPGRNFKRISSYLTLSETENTISAATASDLDLDDIFCYIDRTGSCPGQQYLYKKLYSPDSSEAYFAKLELKMEKFDADQDLREQTELKLSELNTNDAYNLPGLFLKAHQSLFIPAVEFYIKLAAPLIALLIAGMVFINVTYFLLLFFFLIVNVVIHYSNKAKMISYTSSLPQLLILSQVSDWLTRNGVFDEYENIKQSVANVSKLKKSLSFISVQNKIAADPTDLGYLFTEWIKMLFLLEPLNFISSIIKVNKYKNDIRVVFEHIGEVDMAISILSLRKGLPYYCKPEFLKDSAAIVIEDLYHPLIENCVPNSITIDNRQGVLVTGSNMSGKTTFIRAIAINTLFAQTINTSFASVYKAPSLRISTSINMSDELSEHKSYFQAEALAVRNIINECEADITLNNLVIIDEIFRGTNTIERIAAAKAVLSHFTENKVFVLVSTHDLELAELLGDEYKVFSFEEIIGEDRLIFDYKLKEGILKNKNGIAVLKGLDYPQNIINEASRISGLLREKYNL